MSERYAQYRALHIDFPHEHVLRIAFNNPDQMNALSARAHTELAGIWRDISADPAVRAVMLCGHGAHFSVGGDFALVEQMIDDPQLRGQVMREARDLVYNILDCEKPIVSAMQGVAVGGGLAAGLLADISVVARDARLIDGHVRLGVAAGDHAVLLWPLLCGMAKAKFHLLLNEPLSGARAEEIGLVSVAVDEAELQEVALGYALRLAEGAAGAIGATKRAINLWLRAAGPAFEASLAAEFMGFSGEEVREGLAAHREKRPPAFTKISAP